MKYKKPTKIKYGRVVNKSGPRDLQKRMNGNPSIEVVIDELRLQVKRLTKELLTKQSAKNIITPERLDAEITKEVTIALENTKKEYKIIIDNLNNKVTSLKERLKSKNELIEVLKNEKEISIDSDKIARIISEEIQKMSIRTNSGFINDRPQMEEVFIDPLDDNAGKSFKSYINIEDVSTNEKEKITDKVTKLKNLLGSLPKQGKRGAL